MKRIRIFTHGEKKEGVNPGMTQKGFADVASLRGYVLKGSGRVFTGSGQRHKDVAEALGFTEYTSDVVFSNGDSAEVVDGKAMIIRENGERVAKEKDAYLRDHAEEAKEAVAKLDNNDQICAGRPLGIMLKMAGAIDVTFVDTAVYDVFTEDGRIVKCVEICALGKIDPILQAGQ